MKKKILMFAFILLSYLTTYGQQINIKKATVYKVITKIVGKAWQEGQEEGPVIDFQLEIINNTDSTIKLNSSQSKFIILYICNNKKYNIEECCFSLLKFYKKEYIEIKPKEKFPLELSDTILSGSGLLNYKVKNGYYDYTKEMLEILPTLQIQYVDPKFNIVSGKIENVDAKDYFYTVGSHRGK